MRCTRKYLFFACLWVFTVCFPSILSAQDVGDRLRVTFLEGSISGTVVSMSSSSFEINQAGNRTRLVLFDDIRKLERSLGTRSYWKEGLLYGAGLGVAAGILYGALTHEACDVLTLGSTEEFCDEVGYKTTILSAAVWGGGIGLGGLIVGSLIRRQEWAAIPIPNSVGQLNVKPWIDVTLREKGNPMVFAGASFAF